MIYTKAGHRFEVIDRHDDQTRSLPGSYYLRYYGHWTHACVEMTERARAWTWPDFRQLLLPLGWPW